MRIKVRREGNLNDRPLFHKAKKIVRADGSKEDSSEDDVPRVLETAANSARNLPKCLSVGRVTSCNR